MSHLWGGGRVGAAQTGTIVSGFTVVEHGRIQINIVGG